MPFITQGKTNLKYILIVVVLAIIVGSGILAWQYWYSIEKFLTSPEVSSTNETANWKTYKNSKFNYLFKYPEDKAEVIVREREALSEDEALRQPETTCCIIVKSNDQILFEIDILTADKMLEEWLEKELQHASEQKSKHKKSLFAGKEALVVKAGTSKQIIVINNNILYFIMPVIQDTDTFLIDQILSTFKFLE